MSGTKIGLALGGGGAKGSYQLGVIKAIEEYNFLKDIEVISGTSIGAINTMLLMGNLTHSQMLDVWKIFRNEKIYESGINLSLKTEELFDVSAMFKELSKRVETSDIRNSKYQCYVTAAELPEEETRLSQFKYKDMKKKHFHLNTFIEPRKAVMASSSIPGLFGSTKILGKRYVDGGILDNHSMEPIMAEKCNIVFNIPVDKHFDIRPYLRENLFILDFASNECFHSTIVMDFIDALRFDSKKIEERYRYGYLVGKRVLEKLFNSPLLNKDLTFKKPTKFILLGLTPEEDLAIYNKVQEEFK